MNFKLELLEKELKLEKLREEKKETICTQQYDKAAKLRDEEKIIEKQIKVIVEEVQKLFDETIINSENYSEQVERSLLLMRYYVTTENILLKEKIVDSIKYYNKMRTLDLSIKNRALYLNFEEKTKYLKMKLQDCFPHY